MDDPNPQGRVARVFDAAADDYDAGIGLFERFGRRLVEVAALEAGERVLDLACGTGASLIPAAAAVGPSGKVHGADLSPAMVERCRSRLHTEGHRHGQAVVMDAEELSLGDSRFDAILCGFGVFFMTRPEASLVAIRRNLTPTGRFAFTLFDGPVLWEWLNPTLLAFTPRPHPQPHPMWSAEGSVELLTKAGFASAEVHHLTEDLMIADIAVLWSWLWALGSRMLLERMDTAALEALRHELADRLEEHRADSGHLATQQAVAVVAWPSKEEAQ
ncbi:hypothetical protein BH23ACT5_BH23ACT5_12200 [soil metagenome]